MSYTIIKKYATDHFLSVALKKWYKFLLFIGNAWSGSVSSSMYIFIIDMLILG